MPHPLLLVGFATCLATLLGGFFVLRHRAGQHYCFAFAAGSLVAVSFLDLLPESLAQGAAYHIQARALLEVLVASFFVYSFIDRFFLTHHLHDDDDHGHPMGLVGAGSLVVHSCLDGVAIGVAFKVSPSVGLIVATAVLVHDMTDGLNTVVVMLKHRQSAGRARLFLALDAVAPLAGLAVATVLPLPGSMLAWLLAFFCGEFLYLGAGSLLPETRKHGSWGISIALLLGAGLIALVTSLV
ncbi:MAG: ZIP family metal transporter [bacterium]